MILVCRDDPNRHPIVKALRNADWVTEFVDFRDISRLKRRGDLKIITTDPISFISARLLSVSSAKILFISLEMYEYQRSISGVKSFLRFLFYRTVHKYALVRADLVVFPNRARKLFYLRQGVGFVEPPVVVENVPSLQRMQILSCDKMISLEVDKILSLVQTEKVVLYAGSLSPERRIDELVKSFGRLHGTSLLIAGKDSFGSLNFPLPENVHYIGELDNSISLELLKNCDAQIGLYSTITPNTRLAAPIKLYESLTAGVPIILNDEIASKFSAYSGVVAWTKFQKTGFSNLPQVKENQFESYTQQFKSIALTSF